MKNQANRVRNSQGLPILKNRMNVVLKNQAFFASAIVRLISVKREYPQIVMLFLLEGFLIMSKYILFRLCSEDAWRPLG